MGRAGPPSQPAWLGAPGVSVPRRRCRLLGAYLSLMGTREGCHMTPWWARGPESGLGRSLRGPVTCLYVLSR